MRSLLKWVGHVERMVGERLMKRVDVLRVEGRRGRQRFRWEDCEKRDLVGVENESEGWGEWRGLVETAVKPHQQLNGMV